MQDAFAEFEMSIRDRYDRRFEAAGRAFLLLVLLGVASCGGDDGGNASVGPPPPPPPKIESGSFDVTATLGYNGCGSYTNFSGTYEIEIDSLSARMGSWAGTWDPATLRADCESAHSQQITRGCTITTWTAVTITFSNVDTFYGAIVYRKRVVPSDCPCCRPCQSSWNIQGTRVTP
jgi:hypothetical protein